MDPLWDTPSDPVPGQIIKLNYGVFTLSPCNKCPQAQLAGHAFPTPRTGYRKCVAGGPGVTTHPMVMLCLVPVLLAMCCAAPQYTTVFLLPAPTVQGNQLRLNVADMLLAFNVTSNFTLENLVT